MKRFYIALTLLSVIIISSVFFNLKIEDKSRELIELTESNAEADKIHFWWEQNKLWFEIFVPEELKKGVETNILLYKNLNESETLKAQIKTSAEKVLEATSFSISNIF